MVTWAVGHLLELAEPKEYDTKWRSWSIKLLPILPEALSRSSPKDGHKKRLQRRSRSWPGKQKTTTGVINACDAGREGELIFRRIVEYCELDAIPQERLWLQSMTQRAPFVEAFDNLRPGARTSTTWPMPPGCGPSATGSIGMNATRALTQRLKGGARQEVLVRRARPDPHPQPHGATASGRSSRTCRAPSGSSWPTSRTTPATGTPVAGPVLGRLGDQGRRTITDDAKPPRIFDRSARRRPARCGPRPPTTAWRPRSARSPSRIRRCRST